MKVILMVKKNNYLDRVKKSKYSKLTPAEKKKQNAYFNKWVNEMLKRKKRGDEKYGNYMMDVDKKTSFRELEEEMLDVCNHLIMLTYKLKVKFENGTKK